MQGITLFMYKSLLESLSKLRQFEIFNLPEDHLESVMDKENKLKNIYAEYMISLERVSENIKQFEKHKHSIRRLIKKSKQYSKRSSHIKKSIKLPVTVS